MMLNTTNRFGLVSILLHWTMAIVILGLFAVGWYMVDLSYYDSLYNVLPFAHKSIGLLLAVVFLFWVWWRWINPSPKPEQGSRNWEIIAAKITKVALYSLIALISISGYLISTADGSSIDVFNLFAVPASVTTIPQQEDTAGMIHKYLAYVLIGLVLLHAAAALKHHFINKDNSLRRMMGIG